MQDWFREHQILKKVLVVQLPRHLEFLEVLILLRGKKVWITIKTMTVTKDMNVMDILNIVMCVTKLIFSKNFAFYATCRTPNRNSGCTKGQTNQGE